jgi:hypothetical protein
LLLHFAVAWRLGIGDLGVLGLSHRSLFRMSDDQSTAVQTAHETHQLFNGIHRYSDSCQGAPDFDVIDVFWLGQRATQSPEGSSSNG